MIPPRHCKEINSYMTHHKRILMGPNIPHASAMFCQWTLRPTWSDLIRLDKSMTRVIVSHGWIQLVCHWFHARCHHLNHLSSKSSQSSQSPHRAKSWNIWSFLELIGTWIYAMPSNCCWTRMTCVLDIWTLMNFDFTVSQYPRPICPPLMSLGGSLAV